MIALIFDTETTGFPNPKSPPEIVQIGALLQDMETNRVLAELNLIVKPSKPIPQACIDVHGITDELAARHGVKPDIADGMFAVLAAQADVLVAHNIKFDREVIAGVWSRSPAIMRTKTEYCTMLEGAKIDIPKHHAGRSKWPKLSDSYRYFYGSDFENAHDAMADVRACRDVYIKLTEDPAANVRKVFRIGNEQA